MDTSKVISLIKNFMSGDKEAIGEIYESTVLFVYKYVYSRLGNKEWTEDVVSETYSTFLTIAEKYNGESKIETFIIGIANNKINQFLSKLPQDVDYDENIIVPEENYSEEDKALDNQKLMAVLGQLSDEYKKVLENRFLNSLNIRDTAQIMNISEANVRVLQHRALKKASEIANTLFISNTQNELQ